MNNIPLPKSNKKEDIDTTIIAIKKQLEQINNALGLGGETVINNYTTDTTPVGTIIQQYKKTTISGYLYLDGSAFDVSKYPKLYTYLGTNILPDYRECCIVGAEENTTDTIATHDVYTEGQFKDDALQKITGRFSLRNMQTNASATTGIIDGCFNNSMSNSSASGIQSVSAPGKRTELRFNSSLVTRNDANADVTRGKRKAAYFYIKAV